MTEENPLQAEVALIKELAGRAGREARLTAPVELYSEIGGNFDFGEYGTKYIYSIDPSGNLTLTRHDMGSVGSKKEPDETVPYVPEERPGKQMKIRLNGDLVNPALVQGLKRILLD